MSADRVADLTAPLFLQSGPLHGRYTPSEYPFTVIPGVAAGFQAPIFPAGSAVPRLLRAYPIDVGSGELVRAHWRNEIRALLRVSSIGHPSLPIFREGSYQDEQRLGYVIVDYVGVPVDDMHPLRETLRRSALTAFRRWFALVEASMLVQDEGLIHRMISPTSACAKEEADAHVVLDGFQMSAFASTWVRSAASGAAAPAMASLSGATLACIAPERAAPLLGLPRRFGEGFRSDVFGLGMLAILWLANVPTNWAADLTSSTYTEEKHRALVLEARSLLASSRLPRPLRALLEGMTTYEPANRIPSVRVAYEEAAKLYGAILRDLTEREETGQTARAIYYLKETLDRLYQENRASSSPEHPQYDEYNRYIERDLDGGVLVWSSDGFAPWDASSKDDKTKLARIVLLGREYAYFSQYRELGTAQETDRAIVVKYVIPVHRVRELRNAPKAMPIPKVEAQFFAPSPWAKSGASGPSWKPIVDAVTTTAAQSVRTPVVRASNWMIGAQRAQIVRYEYRFRRDATAPNAIILRQHPETEEIDPSTEEGAFATLVRDLFKHTPMGEHFKRAQREAEERDDLAEFEWVSRRGEPASSIKLIFEEKLDDFTVRFRTDPFAVAVLPGEGYIWPVDASRHVLRGQRRAVQALELRQRHLAAQLASPSAVRLRGERPPAADDPTAQLVRRLFETWPFFALQGPPGTGKTFVASQLVREILEDDPYARVLVTAQSHHALDNLLEQVARALGTKHDTILLRIATERVRDKVADAVTGYLADTQLAQIVEKAKKIPQGMAKHLSPLSKRWRRALGDLVVDADLAHRLTQAASLVFVSCAGAAARELQEDSVWFDWVVAEEAARGWLTEFLVPLVHGSRWLLIGDQAQLPAFGRKEMEALLQRDAEQRCTEAVTGTPVDATWKSSFLSHFSHLMQPRAALGTPAAEALNVQRRMHPHIGEMIKRAFYPEIDLQHHPSTERPHGLSIPGVNHGTALVWIDTSSAGRAGWESSGKGLVNELERRLVTFLLNHGLHPKAHEPDVPPLAVLSPYKAQVKALRNNAHAIERDRIHTVDSVQGRQAEVVVVSLVRNNAAVAERDAIGFLAEPERVNVMFSRARRLLVIIGALSHFERFAGPHWQAISAYVRGDKRFLVDFTDTRFRLGGA